jgi:hypothetical protein
MRYSCAGPGKGGAVFLRRIQPRGRGRRQEYWVLLESYRSAKGSRHRVVAYLGKLSDQEVSGWEKLAARLDGKPLAAPGLFDPPPSDASDGLCDPCDGVESVDLKNIRLQNIREFGQAYLAWTLWRMLGLDELLSDHMPRGHEDVPWSVTAAILCIARFCHPSSELYIERHFYPKSALEDLLGVGPAQVQTDRLYRGLDHLLKHKQAIEQHLRRRLGRLFDLSFDVLLYDPFAPLRAGSDQHLLRGPVRRQRHGQAWLFPRQPVGLPAGGDRAAGHDRRLPAGPRGVRREHRRLDHGAEDRGEGGGRAR